MPEPWQQQLQSLQEDTAAVRGVQGNTGLGPAAGPPATQMFMRRTSSIGIDALAEAAVAALAAHPELLMQDRRGVAAAAPAPAPEQPGACAAEQNDEREEEEEAGLGALPSGGQQKRAREEQAPAGCRARAEMGPPATSFKRPCAGLFQEAFWGVRAHHCRPQAGLHPLSTLKRYEYC